MFCIKRHLAKLLFRSVVAATYTSVLFVPNFVCNLSAEISFNLPTLMHCKYILWSCLPCIIQTLSLITFCVLCVCLKKSFVKTSNPINCWQIICLIQFGQQVKFVSVITYHIQSVQECYHAPYVRAPYAIWTAIQRSISCLLKTTGHNKWIILFTIKAPVPKWIPLMFKIIFHAPLRMRSRHSTMQEERDEKSLP